MPHADELADKIPTLGVIKSPGLVSYHSFGTKNLKTCGTPMATMKRAIDQRLKPKGAALSPDAVQAVTVRGHAVPPRGGWAADSSEDADAIARVESAKKGKKNKSSG